MKFETGFEPGFGTSFGSGFGNGFKIGFGMGGNVPDFDYYYDDDDEVKPDQPRLVKMSSVGQGYKS